MSTITSKTTSCDYNIGRIKTENTPDQKFTTMENPNFFSNNSSQSNSTTTLATNSQLSPNTNSIETSNHSPLDNTSTLSKEYSQEILDSLQLVKDLDLFLVTAPANWHENQVIRRYFLNKEEGFVSCVYWNNLYFITGTDIVRCIAYKMSRIGREVTDRKKFEEGIFSDLRALKCGSHAILENSRSPFLKFLHRNQCLRTQKKQKVFFWFSVPHNKLFNDVLERDLKRELSNQQATTKPISSVFKSFKYDQSFPLVEQLSKHFSICLGKNVDHLILHQDNFALSTDDIKNENTNHDYAIEKINTKKANAEDNHRQNQTETSDDFPLDFFSSSNQLLDENYLTSLVSPDNIMGQPTFTDEMLILLIQNSQLPVSQQHQLQPQSMQYQQNQNQNQNQQNQNQNQQIPQHKEQTRDFLMLDSYGQQLVSASYPQQHFQSANTPLYILSSFPSAIDPSSTITNSQNHENSQLLASNIPQLVPIPVNNAHTMNSENQGSADQLLVSSTDAYSQQNSSYLQHPKNVSPVVSINNSAYLNLPSSNLVPISMPFPNHSTPNFLAQFDGIPIGDDKLGNNNTDDKEGKEITEEENNKQGKGKEASQENSELNSDPIVSVNSNSHENKNIIEQQVGIENIGPNEHNIEQQINPPQDYMMLAIPSLSGSVSRFNFGILGGQMFTPGTFGMEYNFENPTLSAGIGISPVIGFNNGLLSAIQYQPSKSTETFVKKSPTTPDIDALEEENNQITDDVTKIESGLIKKGPLKGILLKDNRSKVVKNKNVKVRTKMKFLNPTLQHLQLDSIFDENDQLYSDDDSEPNDDDNAENSQDIEKCGKNEEDN